MKHFLMSGIISSIAAALTGCATTSDIAAVRDFDPDRYMGTWYEIVRLPQYFERDLNEVKAQYTLNDDGTIRVENSGVRDGERTSVTGKAKLKHPDAKPLAGELRVSFSGRFIPTIASSNSPRTTVMPSLPREAATTSGCLPAGRRWRKTGSTPS